MTTKRVLSGVAHDIAHHAGSGLSYLSPHLAQALREVGSDSTEVELLDTSPYPGNAAELQPLRLALRALSTKAKEILKSNGFDPDEVSSIRLLATPAPWDASGYLLHTRAIITSTESKIYDSGWLS